MNEPWPITEPLKKILMAHTPDHERKQKDLIEARCRQLEDAAKERAGRHRERLLLKKVSSAQNGEKGGGAIDLVFEVSDVGAGAAGAPGTIAAAGDGGSGGEGGGGSQKDRNAKADTPVYRHKRYTVKPIHILLVNYI